MQKFIYVFDDDSRDALLNSAYELLKSDPKQMVYIFVNKEQINFDCTNMQFALSDTLTF